MHRKGTKFERHSVTPTFSVSSETQRCRRQHPLRNLHRRSELGKRLLYHRPSAKGPALSWSLTGPPPEGICFTSGALLRDEVQRVGSFHIIPFDLHFSQDFSSSFCVPHTPAPLTSCALCVKEHLLSTSFVSCHIFCIFATSVCWFIVCSVQDCCRPLCLKHLLVGRCFAPPSCPSKTRCRGR